MWRGTTFPQSQSYHFAASLAHAYRRSRLRLLSDMAWFPLFTTFLGALLVLGLDWRLLILFPLTLTASLSIYVVGLFRQTSRVYTQIKTFYATHQHWRFTSIPITEYLESLYRDMLVPGVEVPEGMHDLFAEHMLPLSEYYRGDYLRFILMETDGEAGAANYVTYATLHHAWIFLRERPRDMDGVAHFLVLHEVGHADPSSTVLSYISRGNFTTLLLSLPVLALMLKWEATTALILGIYLLVFFSLASITLKWHDKHARFIDEVFADYFALRRCPIRWFQNESAKEFAETVCGKSEEIQTADSNYDAPLTKEQVNWRRSLLIDQITRIQKQESTNSEEHIPWGSFRLKNRLIICQQMLLIVVSVALGLQHAPLTTLRFVALVVAMFLLSTVGLTVVLMIQLLDLHWDLNLNAKQISEVPPSEQKILKKLKSSSRLLKTE